MTTKKKAPHKPAPKKKSAAVTKVKARKAPAPAPAPAPEIKEPKAPKMLAAERQKFHKLLLDLPGHLLDRINFLAGDNLNRSQRESSGDLSAYGFHMADAGTDNFDREFALSLVSSE